MADKVELTNKQGEVIYPKTITSNIYDDTGNKLSEVLDNKAEVTDLPNIIGESVVDGDTFEGFDNLTREELKKDLFIDLWTQTYGSPASIGYNATTDKFFVKAVFGKGITIGLDDIEYTEAVRIYNRTTCAVNTQYLYNSIPIRINIPPYNYGNPFSLGMQTSYNQNIQYLILQLSPSYASGFTGANNNPNLIGIAGGITFDYNNQTKNFHNNPKLKYIFVRAGNGCTINVQDSPLLNIASLQMTVEGITEQNPLTTPCTYKVHPDVYAKLTDESNTEWHQIFLDASEKNLIFATTN